MMVNLNRDQAREAARLMTENPGRIIIDVGSTYGTSGSSRVLTIWTAADAEGMRFDIDVFGRVERLP